MLSLRRPSAGLGLVLGLVLLLAAGFALGERQGWTFLVPPLQRTLERKLGHTLRLSPPDSGATPAAGAAAAEPGVRLHFWGGLALNAAWLEVAAPSWSKAPQLLTARDVEVHLRYVDIWRAWRGQQLVIQALRAADLQATLERRADGLDSWQQPGASTPAALPRVESLALPSGDLRYTDAQQGLDATAHASLQDQRLAVQLTARIGRASLRFEGVSDDVGNLQNLHGQFSLQGPSLAAAAAPLGVTLPTTGAFTAAGQLRHSKQLWDVVLERAQVGSSQLNGHFRFDTSSAVPLLSGTLTGPRLHLVDLGPALGSEPAPVKGRAKALPSRPFHLASLRVMNADVAIAVREVDLNTRLLESLRPLNAHLQLSDGVLTLKDIDARTGQGHLRGALTLNGQQDRAHWMAELQWDGVALEHWVHQTRTKGLPPYISGQLQGQASLQGDGRSTAEILATLQGRIRASVQDGAVSHLLVEAGGLDVAETLGVYLRGDDALRLDCAVADLRVDQGTLRPSVLVLDTSDSTAWIDGTLSLGSESMDLRAVVAPKDFSPLTLRAPLHVTGTFLHPQVSVEKGPLGMKLGSALLLGLINPLAAFLPLVDTGNRDDSGRNAQACHAHLKEKLQRAQGVH